MGVRVVSMASRSVIRALRAPLGAQRRAASTSITTLDSGLRVASETTAGETATIGVWINAGSSFETDADNGSAHFLEHMAFKGTNKRTQYQLERERAVILREMGEVMSMREEVVFDELHATAYQGTSLGRTILGPEENIASITQEDLRKYTDTHYTAPNMVFAGAGAIEHEQLVDLAGKSLDKLPAGTVGGSAVSTDVVEHKFTGSDTRFIDQTMKDVHFAMAFETVGWTHPDSVVFMVMQSLLGQWDANSPAGSTPASSLCKELVQEGAATSIMAFNTTYNQTGLFGVYGVADHTTVENFLYIQMNELVSMCHKVSAYEIERAKNQLKTTVAMQLGDGTSAICEDIGRQTLTYGRRLPTEELFARIDAVDIEAVNRVAYDYIHDTDMAFVTFGPRDDPKAKPRRVIPDYNWLRRRTFWLRY